MARVWNVDPLRVLTSTSRVYIRAYLLVDGTSPTLLPSLTMTFVARSPGTGSSSPPPSVDHFSLFAPSFSIMLQDDRIWEREVETMLVRAVDRSSYSPGAGDMALVVRSICAYGHNALRWFPSPFGRALLLHTSIFLDGPLPSPAVGLPSLPGEDREGPLDFVDDDDALSSEWTEDGIENDDLSAAAEAAAILGLETSIYGGGDRVEQAGERGAAAGTSTSASCAICIEEYEAGAEIAGMPCGHRFHSRCLMEWLQRSQTCPFCRFDLFGLDVEDHR